MRNVSSAVVVSLLLGASLASADEAAPSWTYKGETGPSHWPTLKPEYQECKLGKHQSPIDIRGSRAAALPAIEFSYQAAPLNIINNGHTIQVNLPPGSFITVGGKRYDLVQFHFHHPSENRLNGRAFPLELHLVHKDADGKLAVVGVLLADGRANPVIADVWKHIPVEKEKEISPDGVTVDPSGLVPANHAYFTFAGSLTTPPCSEEVTWFLLRTPGTVDSPAVKTFAGMYPNNARPTQPLNGRTVQRSQ